MTWTRGMKFGAAGTAAATLVFIALSLGYLWINHGSGVTGWQFTRIALVIAGVWAAIGTTMGIFIVMIIRKNEGRS